MRIIDLSQDIYEGMKVYPGHLKTVQTPLNRLAEAELCPGSAALTNLNAEFV